jgi:hypothetical protein
MAWVTLPSLAVTFTYVDASGSVGKSVAHLPAATTLADAETAAAGLVVQLLSASDCQVISYSITWGVMNTTPAAPAAGSRVENKAKFSFRTAAGKLAIVSVPGIKSAAVATSGGIISTETSVAALITALTGGIWCDSNGSDLSALASDAQVFHSTTKRQYTTDTNPTT